MTRLRYDWQGTTNVGALTFACGYCGATVGPDRGYYANVEAIGRTVRILVCPNCTQPTFFDPGDEQTPAPRLGRDVKGISDAGVAALYNEVRACTATRAFTAAVLVCRKILMNLACQHGAPAGKEFVFYIDHLEQKGYVPPNGKQWVDQIRKKGNEATHEIALMTSTDAERLLSFVEMLLRFNYEFPSMLET